MKCKKSLFALTACAALLFSSGCGRQTVTEPFSDFSSAARESAAGSAIESSTAATTTTTTTTSSTTTTTTTASATTTATAFTTASTSRMTTTTTSRTLSSAATTTAPTATATTVGQGGTWNTAMSREVLTYMNDARRTAGLPELTLDEGNMYKAAQIRAREIVQQFDHTRPDGRKCFTVFAECGVSYRSAGENLASGQPNAATVFNSWMNSEGHRENIMSGNFTHVSIAALNYNGNYYWVQLFRGN